MDRDDYLRGLTAERVAVEAEGDKDRLKLVDDEIARVQSQAPAQSETADAAGAPERATPGRPARRSGGPARDEA